MQQLAYTCTWCICYNHAHVRNIFAVDWLYVIHVLMWYYCACNPFEGHIMYFTFIMFIITTMFMKGFVQLLKCIKAYCFKLMSRKTALDIHSDSGGICDKIKNTVKVIIIIIIILEYSLQQSIHLIPRIAKLGNIHCCIVPVFVLYCNLFIISDMFHTCGTWWYMYMYIRLTMTTGTQPKRTYMSL